MFIIRGGANQSVHHKTKNNYFVVKTFIASQFVMTSCILYAQVDMLKGELSATAKRQDEI